MGDSDKTVDKLSALPFKHFEDEWVKSAWDNDFTDIGSLPIHFEDDLRDNNYYVSGLCKVCDVLEPWILRKDTDDGQGFWIVLVDNNLSFKGFTAFLSYIMDLGHKRLANAVQKEAGLLAASSYLRLVTIPGSGAFKIFHPMLFQMVMDMLKSWTQLGIAKRKRQSSESNSSQRQSQKGRGSAASQQSQNKRSKRSRREPEDISFEFDDEDDDDEEDGIVTPADIMKLRSGVMRLIKDFLVLLDNFALKQSESSGHYAIQVLAELTKYDVDSFDGDFNEARLGHLPLPGLAYLALSKLCSSSHGDLIPLVTSVFKYLLPNILMLIGENKGVVAQTIPRETQLIKDHTIIFVCYLLKECGALVLSSVRILIQHMCVKVADKTEYRTRVAQSVIILLREFPIAHYAQMLQWFQKFSRNAKIGYRVFALELASLLLSEPQREADDSVAEELVPLLSHQSLVQVVLGRCSDIGPTVRTKAISILSNCLKSKDDRILRALHDLVTPHHAPDSVNRPRLIPTPEVGRQHPVTDQGQPNRDQTNIEQQQPLPENAETPASGTTPVTATSLAPGVTPAAAKRETPVAIGVTPTGEVSMSDNEGFVSMLRRRASDERVNVRKAAIQALESMIRLDSPHYRLEDLHIIKERCQDPALSVRRQSMLSLTDLLMERPDDKQLQCAWLDGVLPLVIDRETTAQEKCMEILEEILLSNIVPYIRSTSGCHRLVWNLLDIIAGHDGVDLRRYLQKTCQHWCKQGKIKANLITSLQSHVNTENNVGMWMLLAEVARSLPKFNSDFVIDFWNEKAKNCEESEYVTYQRVLVVLSCLANNLSDETRTTLIADLNSRLLRFDSPPELIAVTVSTLSKLCDVVGDQSQKVDQESWCVELLIACDHYLSSAILNENQEKLVDEDLIIKHLFTLGEITQLCPSKTPRRVFMLVQSLIAAPCLNTQGENSSSQSSQKPITVCDDTSTEVSNKSTGSEEELFQISPSQASQGCSQGSSQNSQGSQATLILSQFRGSRMSPRIRAHAFITLGKLCLQNEDVAKKCVAAIARELEFASDPAIRNNVVIIMCDLCIRYTTLVDRYVSNIAACLKDPAPIVRKQTLTLLTRLLQEDFLKWKGVLFYRFITSLLDDHKDIKQFAEFCLVHILLVRNPNMFFHHLTECIFHFNAYEQHSMYNKFQQSDREKTMFSLKGKLNAGRRLQLYCFMLDHMTDEQKFQLAAKITQDILGAIVDDLIPLNVDSNPLIQDALAILSSKEIKLSSMRVRPADDVVEEQEMAAVVIATAKRTLITQVMKKNVIENIVPVVISLKHMLEKHRSPVIKNLMLYLRELMNDYKTEVQDILSADRQLATEIEFDLRKFEEQQLQASAANTPIASPHLGTSSRSASSRVSGAGTSPAVARAGSPSPKPTTVDAVATSGAPRAVFNVAGVSPMTPMSGNKNLSISTLAILNSAKKAMERGRQIAERRKSQSLTQSSPRQGQSSPRSNQNPSHPKPASPSANQAAPCMSLIGTLTASQVASPQVKQNVPLDKQPGQPSPKAKFTSPNGRSVNTRRKTVSPDVDVLLQGKSPDEGQSEQPSDQAQDSNPFKTPAKMSRASRAISTPAAALGNITFQADPNVTLIPPSPIQSTRSANERGGWLVEDKDDLIYMLSPDKPRPKPKKWNIISPAPVKSRPFTETDVVEEEENQQPNENRSRRVARPKRKSVTTSNSKYNDFIM